jgi:hypothetical protein
MDLHCSFGFCLDKDYSKRAALDPYRAEAAGPLRIRNIFNVV